VGRKARMLHAMPETKAAQAHLFDFSFHLGHDGADFLGRSVVHLCPSDFLLQGQLIQAVPIGS
jgi:hypothetical protein